MITEKIGHPLKLTSDNELVLHFIGTGSAFTKKNYQNNLIVIKNGTHVVIDFGTKASQGIFEKGVSVSEIKAFLVTHTHADHVGSFEEAALVGRYFTKKSPDMIVPKILEKMLWEKSMSGGIAFNEEPELTLRDVFHVITPKKVSDKGRPEYYTEYKGIGLRIFKTNHVPGTAKSWKDAAWASGVVIDDRVIFTADTKFDLEMLETFDRKYNIELILHDCQFFTGGVHASYDELKAMPEKLKKKTLLTHYADNWEKFNPEADGFMGFTKPDLYYKFPLK
jgi:ribonuclease BN (tRNA processing enzyme)